MQPHEGDGKSWGQTHPTEGLTFGKARLPRSAFGRGPAGGVASVQWVLRAGRSRGPVSYAPHRRWVGALAGRSQVP